MPSAAVGLRRPGRNRSLTDEFQSITVSLDKLDSLQGKLLDLIPPQIAIQQKNRDLTLTNYAISSGTNADRGRQQNATALGQAFDDAKNDDSFYLPPEAFTNPAFLRGMKLFLSPDGKAARMIITHQGDPQTAEGISHIERDQGRCLRRDQGHSVGRRQYLRRRGCIDL